MQLRHTAQVLSLCSLLALFVQHPVAAARAQSPAAESSGASEPAQYRETVDEALKEFAIANYVEARALFQRAHALYPNARTLRGLGMAEFELRHYVECIQHLEAALASQVKPFTDELYADTKRLLARANNFVARIELHIKPTGARVLIDGAPLAPGGAGPVVLAAGDHTLEVQAPGFVSEQRKLSVQGGEQQTLSIPLATSTSSTPKTAAPKTERGWYKNPWLWVGVGFVVAGAAAGAGYALTREEEIAPAYGGSSAMVLKGP